jgi:CRP/FNR family transcriptional regulator, cyclic AMP receptor protein
MMSIIEKVVALEGYELFRDLTSDQVSRIAEWTTECSFQAGEVLFRENEPADTLFFLLEGSVVLKRGGEQVGTADAGNRFLEGMRILTGTERGITAEAQEPCRLLRLAQEDLFSILYDSPEIAIRLIRVLAQAVIEVRLRPLPDPAEPDGL